MLKVKWPERELEALIATAQGNVREFASEFIQDLNNEVVIETPVRTGFLRGSWFAALNSVPSGSGSAGRASAEDMNVAAVSVQLGDTYYAVNTAAYAARIEFGFFGRDKLGRVYNQPGRGFVRAVIARALEIAQSAAERVGGGRRV